LNVEYSGWITKFVSKYQYVSVFVSVSSSHALFSFQFTLDV